MRMWVNVRKVIRWALYGPFFVPTGYEGPVELYAPELADGEWEDDWQLLEEQTT